MLLLDPRAECLSLGSWFHESVFEGHQVVKGAQQPFEWKSPSGESLGVFTPRYERVSTGLGRVLTTML